MPRFVNTTRKGLSQRAERPSAHLELTIAYHPDLRRIGASCTLDSGTLSINRLTPAFVNPDEKEAVPLDDPFISRRMIDLKIDQDAAEIRNPQGREVRVNGQPIDVRWRGPLPKEGLVIELADRVVLLAQKVVERPSPNHEMCRDLQKTLGLIGPGTRSVLEQVCVLSEGSSKTPVLIRGETGAGKELIARALHFASSRSEGPFVAVNMAAIPPTTAAAELFGHAQGAFTGAAQEREGFFQRAEGGTLFLDEIGETPQEIQPMLLRALDNAQIQPVGGPARSCNVAIVAATDADLEQACKEGQFRSALLHRLGGAQLQLEPLRARRADIGPLLGRFIERERAARALPPLDQTMSEQLWMSARLAARFLLSDWPGNVRQLKNAVQRAVLLGHRRKAIEPDAGLEAMLAPPEPQTQAEELSEDRLVEVLRAHRFQLNRAAKTLGLSRSGLDALIARSDRIRKAKDLTRAQIDSASQACGGNLVKMAEQLEVSARGLKLRMTQLGP